MSDPDETEGRKLYRARADALAQSQLNISKRKVTMARPHLNRLYIVPPFDILYKLGRGQLETIARDLNIVNPHLSSKPDLIEWIVARAEIRLQVRPMAPAARPR